jgi:predicted XRE-type DNA-binding protein
MSLPLDQLYHYIENVAQEIHCDRIIIYRFYPHGSKNINELNNLHESDTWLEKTIYPLIWCNDQEPLDYEFYKKNFKNRPDTVLGHFLKPPKNLNYRQNIFEKNLLLHSEKRSNNLKKYQLDDELIPVYYWSHAVIARDWFRYAEHVAQKKQVTRTFLIYNRAWSNTREYRLRFAELLIHLNLQDCCQTSINPIEPELNIHYNSHQFKNSAWQPRTVLENYFPINTAHSHYSADFDLKDYEATDVEVVLETLFDDGRLHLTEKSLRPIAVGQPFILAGTQGSLEYLRGYGFKTFDTVWDESYDLVEDPAERLIQIAELMKYISNWLPHQREHNMAQAQAIADYNQQHFFSRKFFNQVTDELKTNLKSAFDELEQCNNFTAWFENWKILISNPELINFLTTNQDVNLGTKQQFDFVFQLIENKLNNKL